MLILTMTIFVASLVGSLHCAGMCGSFVMIATGGAETDFNHRIRVQMAYHFGRLLTYISLGALAGGIGAIVDVAGRLAGLQQTATILAGVCMVMFGVVSLFRWLGINPIRHQLPRFWIDLVSHVYRKCMTFEPTLRACLIGVSTTLLPCGWLYAFAVTAAGTGNPILGALTMTAFWFGTLPVMVSLGTGFQAVLGRLGPKLPGLTCLVLIGVGAYTLVNRSLIDTVALAERVSASTDRIHQPVNCCSDRP
ncbi:MAG: hypothetical protein KatS3mg104_1407 [Phycisphaerae bacterium]|nr:MAG: hypothetical protein KatS3mg104_1407 [Phycisphaerae bacterium]